VWELDRELGVVPALAIDRGPALCPVWEIDRASAIAPVSAIDRHARTSVIVKIDFRIDSVTDKTELVIGWRTAVTAHRTAAINGTIGTVGITTITATGITVIGTAIGDRDRDGTIGGTAIRC